MSAGTDVVPEKGDVASGTWRFRDISRWLAVQFAEANVQVRFSHHEMIDNIPCWALCTAFLLPSSLGCGGFSRNVMTVQDGGWLKAEMQPWDVKKNRPANVQLTCQIER